MTKVNDLKINANADNVTFGVEIECYMPNSWMTANDIRIGNHGHGRNLPSGTSFRTWTAESDGSLGQLRNSNGNYNYEYTAVEFVSTVLLGNAGLEEVYNFMKFLKDGGMKVSNSCGFHVHIGVDSVMTMNHRNNYDMIASWVSRLVHLVAKHESGLISLTGNDNRLSNQYCQTIKTANYSATKFDSNWGDLVRTVGREGRYRVVNLLNLFHGEPNKRTVEFRCFAGTVTPRKAVGYVIAAVSLAVKAARRGNAVKFDSSVTNVIDSAKSVEKLINETRGAGRITGAEMYYRGAFSSWRYCAAHINDGNGQA